MSSVIRGDAIPVPQIRLSDLCEVIQRAGLSASLEGEDHPIAGVNTLDDAGHGEVTFLANPKYRRCLAKTRASAVIIHEGVDVPERLSAIR